MPGKRSTILFLCIIMSFLWGSSCRGRPQLKTEEDRESSGRVLTETEDLRFSMPIFPESQGGKGDPSSSEETVVPPEEASSSGEEASASWDERSSLAEESYSREEASSLSGETSSPTEEISTLSGESSPWTEASTSSGETSPWTEETSPSGEETSSSLEEISSSPEESSPSGEETGETAHEHRWGPETCPTGDGLMYRRDCLECGAWTKRWAVTELREFWWVSWTDETGNPVTEAYSSEEEQLMRVDALGQQQISASYGNGYETVILDWIYSESTE